MTFYACIHVCHSDTKYIKPTIVMQVTCKQKEGRVILLNLNAWMTILVQTESYIYIMYVSLSFYSDTLYKESNHCLS